MRERSWLARKSVALTCASLVLLMACSPNSQADTKRSTEELMNEALEGARRIREVEKNFAKSRPYKGANALAYINDLKREGFACRLQYRKKFRVGKSEEMGTVSATLDPGVECVREPSQFPECVEFRVSLGVAWKDTNVEHLRDLLPQLSDSALRESFFICETDPMTAEGRSKLADGYAKGYVVKIQ